MNGNATERIVKATAQANGLNDGKNGKTNTIQKQTNTLKNWDCLSIIKQTPEEQQSIAILNQYQIIIIINLFVFTNPLTRGQRKGAYPMGLLNGKMKYNLKEQLENERAVRRANKLLQDKITLREVLKSENDINHSDSFDCK